jgi:hypothetical protein
MGRYARHSNAVPSSYIAVSYYAGKKILKRGQSWKTRTEDESELSDKAGHPF